MKRIKQALLAIALVAGVGLSLTPAPVAAVNVFNQCNGNTSVVCQSASKDDASSTVKTVINTLLYILGIVAVIMIIVGAFRYVLSAGDAGAVTAAKNTILYAVVGLIVAILAFVIVNFVINAVR
jgi:hypothetical protein